MYIRHRTCLFKDDTTDPVKCSHGVYGIREERKNLPFSLTECFEVPKEISHASSPLVFSRPLKDQWGRGYFTHFTDKEIEGQGVFQPRYCQPRSFQSQVNVFFHPIMLLQSWFTVFPSHCCPNCTSSLKPNLSHLQHEAFHDNHN